MTLQEVLDEIERWSDDEEPTEAQHTIFISPPADGNETEEDSGDENCADYNNLGPKMLQVEAFISERGENNIRESGTTIEADRNYKRKWTKGDIQDISNIKLAEWESRPPPLALSNESHPLDFFMLFFQKNLWRT